MSFMVPRALTAIFATMVLVAMLFSGSEAMAAGVVKPLVPELVKKERLPHNITISVYIPVQNCEGETCDYVQMNCKDSENIDVEFTAVSKITLDSGDSDVELISGGKVFNIWVKSAEHSAEEARKWFFFGSIADSKAFIDTAFKTSRAALKVQESLYPIANNADWRSFAQQCAATKRKSAEAPMAGKCLFDYATYGNVNNDLEAAFRKGEGGQRSVRLDSNTLAIHMTGVGEISSGVLARPYVTFSDGNDRKLFDVDVEGYKISADKIVDSLPDLGDEASDAIVLSGLRTGLTNLRGGLAPGAATDFFQLKSCIRQ